MAMLSAHLEQPAPSLHAGVRTLSGVNSKRALTQLDRLDGANSVCSLREQALRTPLSVLTPDEVVCEVVNDAPRALCLADLQVVDKSNSGGGGIGAHFASSSPLARLVLWMLHSPSIHNDHDEQMAPPEECRSAQLS